MGGAVWAAAVLLTGLRPGLGAEGQIPSAQFIRVLQSSDAAATNVAAQAMDGNGLTFSLTTDTPGSFWQAELGRAYALTRVELVNRAAPNDAAMGGLTLRLLNMDDQVVFETGVTNPGSGGVFGVNLPAGLQARILWVGLAGSQTNGAGNYRVGLAEARLFGVLDMPHSPEPFGSATNVVRVWQSSDFSTLYPAANAVDGTNSTFSHTADIPNSYWMADLGRVFPLDRIEIVNRTDCCGNRMSNLVLRVYDGASNTISSVVLTNTAQGSTYTHNLAPAGNARWIRVGLENNQQNGGTNYYVTIGEIRAFAYGTNVLKLPAAAVVSVTNNLASFKNSYMLRLNASVPAASNANDDNYSTETKTTSATVDGYWEVDLGATYALYGVRSIAASGIGTRLTNATVRLYDANHNSVFGQRITGAPDVFDTDLNGPIFARYVRVGLENKKRTSPTAGTEWLIGFREVEVYGRPTNGLGIISFAASTNRIESGQSVTLAWSVAEVRRVEIFPGVGSVGARTGTNGAGSLEVWPTNTTEYLLIASNAAGLFSRSVRVEVGPPVAPLKLSEFVADNQFSLKDGYGEASDWIEIRNTGGSALNLAGYALSDDPSRPRKWIFPATNLAPHSLLVVFASGREEPVDPSGFLHASFRLSKEGGELLLTDPQTNLLDQVGGYAEQDTDLAYGRDLEGRWTFMEPSPGNLNTGATYQGWLASLSFSHPRGFYQAPFTLGITNPNPGATLFYSLDGSVPSIPYSNALAIADTRSVRAQARREGFKPARIQTRSFIFLDNVIGSPVMSTNITLNTNYAPRLRAGLQALPIISLVMPGQPEYEEQEGSVEVLWPNGAPAMQENVGVERFGNSWQLFQKRSFRVKARARYGATKISVPLFNGFDRGVVAKTAFDQLEFRSGSQDMIHRGFYLAARFVDDSMLAMGSLNPHGRYVHVFLNGVYWGQFDAREPMEEHFLADYLGGAPEEYSRVRGNDNVGSSFVLGIGDPPVLEPWERVRNLAGSYASVKAYLDVPHLTDFMLLWMYGNCETEFRACGPTNAGSGFKFWMADADGFLRTSAMGLNNTGNAGPGGLFGALVAEGNPDFKTLVADRIYRHFFNDGALTPARNDARLLARMQEVNDSILCELARWPTIIYENPLGTFSSTANHTPTGWANFGANLRANLFPGRTSQLVGYLRTAGLYPSFDPPAFNQYGGVVTNGFQPQLSSAAGAIYYTLDGSDPRLPGGGISAAAQVWANGVLAINQNLVLSARVRTAGGQWSALAQPRFLVAAPQAPTARDLLVTEIHYNPDGSDDFEFVELYNAGSKVLDLSGVSLSNAVRFIFPDGFLLSPGAFVLVVENTEAFAARYQTPGSPWYWPQLSVAGAWVGALDNAGETLTLLASNGLELAAIPYKPSGRWPARADGRGSSLELRPLPPPTAGDDEVRALVADGFNWSASSLYHGSPGRFDNHVKLACINELLVNPQAGEDWIELHNPGTQAVSLANCSLTDDLSLPSRYRFANDTVLLPGEFLVLGAAQLGFAFGEMGEDVYLLQMSGSNVWRFLDSVDYPAAAPDEPFGRFQRQDGKYDFTELSFPTPGATNAPPRIGPLVISEIMFLPAPDKAAFLELTSVTNGPLPLFDPDHPTNLWRLEGVGDFAFPTGVVVAPGATLIVCATNPEAFRAQYNLDAALPVFGPWGGALDQDGETLKLTRPGAPRTNGVAPYYRVDHVTYRATLPWPPATAGGSLHKVPAAAYGNDALNWVAAAPAPGANLAPGEKPVILSPPQSQRLDEGLSAYFSVIATGAPPVTYQWRLNGLPLAGATNSSLVLADLQVSDAGTYDVLVSGPGGASLSPPAYLVVVKLPVIISQPASQWVRPEASASFSIAAVGTGEIRYQWFLNGALLVGQTNNTFVVPAATQADAGRYTVLVSDDLGSIWSAPADLILLVDPVIVQHPLSQPVLAGDTVILSVVVTNTATLPINYRWRRSGLTVTNILLNERVCFFVIQNVQPPYTNWNVVVTNASRPTGFLSSTAILTILADTNANGLPDTWEAAHGFDAENPALPDADPDGDGLSNREEYLAGTDPRDAASCLQVETPLLLGGAWIPFQAVSNRTYSLFYANSLAGGGPWTKLADVPARASNRVEFIGDPGWTTNRFYRVVLPARP